jgi:rubrerythrin
MALLACALIATRPRRFETNVANYMCSVCRGQLDSGSPDSCPNCRIRFR